MCVLEIPAPFPKTLSCHHLRHCHCNQCHIPDNKMAEEEEEEKLLLRNLTTTKPNTSKWGFLQSYQLSLKWITPTWGSSCMTGWGHFFKCHKLGHISCVALLFHPITPPKQLSVRPTRPEMTICPDLVLLDFSAAVELSDHCSLEDFSSFGFTDITLQVFLSALCRSSSLSLNSSFLSAWPLNVEVTQYLIPKGHLPSQPIFLP